MSYSYGLLVEEMKKFRVSSNIYYWKPIAGIQLIERLNFIFCHAGVTRCMDQDEIWCEKNDVYFFMPQVILISARMACGSLKFLEYITICGAYHLFRGKRRVDGTFLGTFTFLIWSIWLNSCWQYEVLNNRCISPIFKGVASGELQTGYEKLKEMQTR